jgi:hypothetical protein
MRIVASLFTTLIPWLGHDVHGYAAESPYAITVHQGRLSVHLQEADVDGRSHCDRATGWHHDPW